jgi:hypothetical protein
MRRRDPILDRWLALSMRSGGGNRRDTSRSQ